MTKREGSLIPAMALWIAVLLLALFLGGSFNAAYFSSLGDSARDLFLSLSLTSRHFGSNIMPDTERVFEVEAVVLVILCALCLGLSYRVAGLKLRRKTYVLVAAVAFPFLTWVVASTLRLLAEEGIFTAIAMRNMMDSRSVAAIRWDHALSLWANHPLFTVLTVVLLLAVLARLVQVNMAKPVADSPA